MKKAGLNLTKKTLSLINFQLGIDKNCIDNSLKGFLDRFNSFLDLHPPDKMRYLEKIWYSEINPVFKSFQNIN